MNRDEFAKAVFDRLPKKLPSYDPTLVAEVFRLAVADAVFEAPAAEIAELEKSSDV